MGEMSLEQVRNGFKPAVPAVPEKVRPGFDSADGFALIQRMANILAYKTPFIPDQYKGAENYGNAVIAVELATRIGASPLQVMQNLYIVGGKPAWSSQFLIATFNQCGRFTALEYHFVGEEGRDSWGCYCTATEKATGKELRGVTVTVELAKREGWTNKKGSKWVSMPGQMLRYRAASWFIRVYAPEISMGIRTADEARDVPLEQDEDGIYTPAQGMTLEDVQDAVNVRPVERKRRGRPPRNGNGNALAEAPAPTPAQTITLINNEGKREPAPAPMQEERPAPTVAPQQPMAMPSATAPAYQGDDEDPRLDELEMRYITQCEKERVHPGAVLDAYEKFKGRPFPPEEAWADMLNNPGLFKRMAEDARIYG